MLYSYPPSTPPPPLLMLPSVRYNTARKIEATRYSSSPEFTCMHNYDAVPEKRCINLLLSDTLDRLIKQSDTRGKEKEKEKEEVDR